MTVTLRGMTWALVVTVALSMLAMTAGAIHTYRLVPPVPEQVVATDGAVVYTAEDVAAGPTVFQRRSLMNYGTVLGNGGYFGPDFTAEYLDRAASLLRDAYAREQFGRRFADLPEPDRAAVSSRVRGELKRNTLDGAVFSASTALASSRSSSSSLLRFCLAEWAS